MKIRIGFVTNSSSTNFLILSKEDLTVDLLYKKLGFKKKSILREQAMGLCENILQGLEYAPEYYDNDDGYDIVLKDFGKKTADKYLDLLSKGYRVYVGRTSSDEGPLTTFFTTSSFEIEEKGFYVNGRSCVW